MTSWWRSVPLSCKKLLASGWRKLSTCNSISCDVPTNNNVDQAHIVDMPTRDVRDRNEVVRDYEAKLSKAKRSALILAFFNKLTHFLGICAVTWATVVLLGGFASALPRYDFYVVATLLILEVGRFSCTLFLTQLVRKDLVHNSQNPRHLSYKDIRQEIVSFLRLLSPLGQIIFLMPTLSLLIWRYLAFPSDLADFERSNFTISIHLFYLFVLCNAMFVMVAVLVSSYHLKRFFFASKRCYDGIIERYFDEVMYRALHNGLTQAVDFDILEFAFDVQARDYKCNVQPLVVKKASPEFFEYLLARRIGLDILSKYLESEDCFKRQAAANIVGFWCDINNPHLKQSLSRLSTDFLENFMRKMEARSQIGWSVTNSLTLLVPTFKILSCEAGQDYMYKLCNLTSTKGMDIVEFLTSKLDPKDSWSISYLRLLAALLHNIDDRTLINLKTNQHETHVVQVLESDKSRSRTKMYAAYVLLKAGKSLKLKSIDDILVKERKDSYFLVQEVYMLDRIRECSDMKPLEEKDWRGIEMRGDVSSPFYFLDKISLEQSSSIQLLRKSSHTMPQDFATSSRKRGMLVGLCEIISLTYQHLWVGGATNHKETKNV